MRRLVLTLWLLGGAVALVGGKAGAQEFPGNPSFKVTKTPAIERLASLVGCWVGKNPWGMPTRISYDLASDGTALVEYLEQQGQVPMYSIYYIDGETLMVHHFCSYGSQIRMRAEPSEDPNVLYFGFMDATNIKSREHDDHMKWVRFTFQDPEHMGIEWGLYQNQKDLTDRFAFTRVKSGCNARHSDVWN